MNIPNILLMIFLAGAASSNLYFAFDNIDSKWDSASLILGIGALAVLALGITLKKWIAK